MRGDGLMAGYFRDAPGTAAVMRPDGWYASGDVGYQGPAGELFVVARLKEMIVRSGFNVYPGEVEAVLMRLPFVRVAAVVGQAEADGNERVVAFVELESGSQLDEVAWAQHLKENLSPYKRPAQVVVVPAMPTTLSGKVLKKDLVSKYLAAVATAS